MTPRVKIEVSAGGVVFKCYQKRPEVILCRHKSFGQKVVWSLPKGWVEPSEKIAEAALREVKEEAGVEGKIVDKIDTIHYWYFHPLEKVKIKKTVHFFLIKAIDENLSQHDFEVDEVRWFPIDEALKVCSYKGEREVISKVVPYLKTICGAY